MPRRGGATLHCITQTERTVACMASRTKNAGPHKPLLVQPADNAAWPGDTSPVHYPGMLLLRCVPNRDGSVTATRLNGVSSSL